MRNLKIGPALLYCGTNYHYFVLAFILLVVFAYAENGTDRSFL